MKRITYKVLALSISSLFFMGCDPIEGLATLKTDLSYKITKNSNCSGETSDWSCFEPDTKVIKAGQHNMKIEQSGKRTLIITIKEGRKQHVIQLDTRKKAIPENGSFSLTADESTQPFDVRSMIKTDVVDGALQHVNLTCEVSQSRGESCYLIPSQSKDQNVVTKHCVEIVDVYKGDRDLEYFNRTTTTRLSGELIQARAQVALLNGQRSKSTQITTFDSGCKNLSFSHSNENSRDIVEKK